MVVGIIVVVGCIVVVYAVLVGIAVVVVPPVVVGIVDVLGRVVNEVAVTIKWRNLMKQLIIDYNTQCNGI